MLPWRQTSFLKFINLSRLKVDKAFFWPHTHNFPRSVNFWNLSSLAHQSILKNWTFIQTFSTALLKSLEDGERSCWDQIPHLGLGAWPPTSPSSEIGKCLKTHSFPQVLEGQLVGQMGGLGGLGFGGETVELLSLLSTHTMCRHFWSLSLF